MLRCTRTALDSAAIDGLRAALAGGLDWARLVRVAEWHGVRPLVAAHIRTAGGADAAWPGLATLEAAAVANAHRNAALAAELVRLIDRLEVAGVRALPYKGPVLASAVYGNLALREFFDLDVLVRRGEVPVAVAVLRAAGYEPQLRLTPAQEATLLDSRYEQVLIRSDGRVVVELQWRVVPSYFSFDLEHDRLWQRPEWVPMAGRRIPTLRAEDLLLVLCVHGTKHHWERLLWVLDVAELLRARPDLDWEEVTETARRLRVERMLGLGLRLARDLLGASCPEGAHRLVTDPALDGLVRETRERMLTRSARSCGLAWSARYHLRAREQLRDRIRYCARLAVSTTPGDWASVRLPDALFPVYYLVRLGRVVLKYGTRMLRDAGGGSGGW